MVGVRSGPSWDEVRVRLPLDDWERSGVEEGRRVPVRIGDRPPRWLFVEGVVWFGEPLNPWRLVAFALIWAALVLYTADGWLRARSTT